jgi:hypothetical protein
MRTSRDQGALDAPDTIPRHKSGKLRIARAPRPAAVIAGARHRYRQTGNTSASGKDHWR